MFPIELSSDCVSNLSFYYAGYDKPTGVFGVINLFSMKTVSIFIRHCHIKPRALNSLLLYIIIVIINSICLSDDQKQMAQILKKK